MMSYLSDVLIRHFDLNKDGELSSEEMKEFHRVEALNNLPFDEFFRLPDHERAIAEEIWSAKALDNSETLFGERQQRVLSKLDP